MKKGLLVSVIGIVIISSFVAIAAYQWWKENTSAVSTDTTKISFIVPKGRSASEVGVSLYQKSLIKNPLTFKIYVQIFDKSDAINAGEFKLSPSMSLEEIIEKLGKGPEELWVTIPEGLRREEVVEIFIDGLEKSGNDADDFRSTFLSLTQGKEGYLFPDTYLFPKEATASIVVNSISTTFDKKMDLLKDEIESSKYTLDEIITMASILERETITDEERPIVAGILWKRLATDGWLVQADATVQYAVASSQCPVTSVQCDYWPILTLENLEIDSPYNSYKYKPLPPTPIANPGLSSIKAAAQPEDSNYWFYIHDPNGTIHYAKDLPGHNLNVRNYLGK